MKLRRGGMGLEVADWGLAELGPDLYTLHGAGGRVVRVGANCQAVLGHDAEALAGNGLIDRVHVHDRVAVAKALGDCLASGEPMVAQFRLAIQAPAPQAGRWYEMRCVAAPRRPDSEPLVMTVIQDVSERRRLEDELRLNRERAESASQAKGLFLANMSHELRTPLNAIIGFSELLQSDAMAAMPPERHREYVELIHSSAGHLLNVLNDILDMSKIEAGRYEIICEPFDLAHCLASCCAMMRGQAQGKRIEIALHLAPDLPEVTADERAIKQVMINLLSNAVKFSHDGGRVEVEAVRVGRNVRISISDCGIGISPEHLEKLGRPFYQADSRYDRRYQGTGLGLSVVRGLVDLHRGKVAFESVKGEGTRVTVTLPVHAHESRPVPACEEIDVVRLHPEAVGGQPRQFTIHEGSRLRAKGVSRA